jgi:adenylate kinase family enzyme
MHFESACCEASAVLYYNVDEDVCISRCMDRAKTSGRTDDNQATIVRRFQNYVDQTKPVISMYERFGKVHEIDGVRDPNEIYEDSRKAVLPQVSFLIGPQGAGKSVLGKALSDRTNMYMMNFGEFVKKNNLGKKDDETQTAALIACLSALLQPRVLLEDFP